jgi:hypothetical protein
MARILREILVRLVLITTGLLLSLLVLEVGVRVLKLYTFPADDFIKPHAELGWSHTPGKEGYWIVGQDRIHIKINSRGLRDKEYPYRKKEGTFRILVLGDSFTEGFQVPLEDTFCKILEYRLNETRMQFEVINAGFAGVGTDYELLFLRREGYKYCPDLVVIAFFGNDIYDNYRSKTILDTKNAPLEYEKTSVITHLKKVLAQNSCAYNYLGYTLPKHVPFLAKVLMKLGLVSFQPIDDVQGVDQLHYLVFAEEYGPEWKKAWGVTQVLISELKKEAEQRRTKLAVVSIPFREQVYENLWQAKLSKPGMRTREWDLRKPDRLLARFLADAEIPFLQLLPHFKEASEKLNLYHSQDGHFDVDGHHLAGQVIYDWLVEEKLVPIEPVKAQSRRSAVFLEGSKLKAESWRPTIFLEGLKLKGNVGTKNKR